MKSYNVFSSNIAFSLAFASLTSCSFISNLASNNSPSSTFIKFIF